MGIDDVPRELRTVAESVRNELNAACVDGDAELAWLADYEVLELRASPGAATIEVYLPRPLLEDLDNLASAARTELLAELRGIPERAQRGAGAYWLLREQGKARALPRRPFV